MNCSYEFPSPLRPNTTTESFSYDNMAELGTEVFFLWDSLFEREALLASLRHIVRSDRSFTISGELSWTHDLFGGFRVQGMNPEGERMCHLWLIMSDVEMLPELAVNPPSSMKPESAARVAYHFIKRLFAALKADLACGATRTDEVMPFNFDDSCVSRLFRLTRDGPQRLIRPFEENRSIGGTLVNSKVQYDCSDNPTTGERNWVMLVDGPLVLNEL